MPLGSVCSRMRASLCMSILRNFCIDCWSQQKIYEPHEFNALARALQMMPLGSHNSSFATKRGVQTPVKSNPMEAVELNDLVNLEVSDGTDEGGHASSLLPSSLLPSTLLSLCLQAHTSHL